LWYSQSKHETDQLSYYGSGFAWYLLQFIELVERKRPHVIVADQSFLVTGDRRTVLFRVATTGFCADKKEPGKGYVQLLYVAFCSRSRCCRALRKRQDSFILHAFRIEPMAIGSLAAIVADDELLWTKLVSYRLMLFWTGFAL